MSPAIPAPARSRSRSHPRDRTEGAAQRKGETVSSAVDQLIDVQLDEKIVFGPGETVSSAVDQLIDVQLDEKIVFGPGGYDFSAPDPFPDSAQKRALELLASGRLFRYQGGADDVAEFEREFSDYIGLPYTMACNSGGCGLFLSLKALGVKPRDKVLVNAWTLAPVPGAIVHAAALPVFVATDPRTLTIDLADLERQAASSGAKVLLLSYMRGQVPDMDALLTMTKRLGLEVIEDCAHTLGATWKLDGEDRHKHFGTFGAIGVWSLQTNKSINAGEGGVISTSRQDIASFLTVATGSYGHYQQNGASGDLGHLDETYTSVPNMSMRMTTMAAALAKPQLAALSKKLVSFERNAMILRAALDACPHVRVVEQAAIKTGKEVIAWSSIQFEILDFTGVMIEEVVRRLAAMGIPLAWFGGPCRGFTSTLKDWKFADPQGQQLSEKHTSTIARLVDLPLYHTSSWGDAVFRQLAKHLVTVIDEVAQKELDKATALRALWS